jgi:hypothetical protein
MFSLPEKRRKGAITVHPALRRAAGLARAFILLEDPELSGPHVPADDPAHPHRVPLRPVYGARRPGAGAPRNHVCSTPVPPRTTMRVGARDWKRAEEPMRLGGCSATR